MLQDNITMVIMAMVHTLIMDIHLMDIRLMDTLHKAIHHHTRLLVDIHLLHTLPLEGTLPLHTHPLEDTLLQVLILTLPLLITQVCERPFSI